MACLSAPVPAENRRSDKLNAVQAERDKLKADIANVERSLQKRTTEKEQIQAKLNKAQQQQEATSEQEQLIRQELLGLRGSMDATFFLVDVSGSVTQSMGDGTQRPNWGGDDNPWTFIRNQIESWVKNLPVKNYRLIAFNHELHEYPTESRWAQYDTDLDDTITWLISLQPNGLTATEKAIRQAHLWKPTSIVLITDGNPSNSSGDYDGAQVERILQFVKSDQFDIPINVVAVNNYFDPRFGSFLHGLAAFSGGSFIGL